VIVLISIALLLYFRIITSSVFSKTVVNNLLLTTTFVRLCMCVPPNFNKELIGRDLFRECP